jgi:hypothetical protein
MSTHDLFARLSAALGEAGHTLHVYRFVRQFISRNTQGLERLRSRYGPHT